MTGPVLASALLVVLAIGLVTSGVPITGLDPGPRRRSANSPRVVIGLVVVGCCAVLMTEVRGTHLVLGLIVLASSGDVLRRTRRRQLRRDRMRRRAQVLAVCEAVAADVRAGVPPSAALQDAAVTWPIIGTAARAARFGADVPDALRGLAAVPGAERMSVVAAAWEVAHRTGSGLAGALDLAARTIRDEQTVVDVVATEISSARATALLLALLPIGVLALGQGIGGNPWEFLLATPFGLGCLATGLGLAHVGLAWLDAITDSIVR